MFVTILIDDILTYLRNKENHFNYFITVPKTIKDWEFYAKFSNNEFWLLSVSFLGHIVSG